MSRRHAKEIRRKENGGGKRALPFGEQIQWEKYWETNMEGIGPEQF